MPCDKANQECGAWSKLGCYCPCNLSSRRTEEVKAGERKVSMTRCAHALLCTAMAHCMHTMSG